MAWTSRDGERLIPSCKKSLDEEIHYLKHLFPYDHFRRKYENKENVLEIGCGDGYGTFHFSKKVQSIIGLDISKKIVNHARDKYPQSNCKFQDFNGCNLPFEDESFDLVISFQVIEHVKDVDFYLQEIKRVLRRGGSFVVTTPNRSYRLAPGEKPFNRFHLREYDSLEFKDVLKKSFSDLELLSISASNEIYKHEKKKYEKKLSSMDPLGLRHFFPSFLKRKIKSILTNNNKQGEIEALPSIEDFFVSNIDHSNCLDLLGICKK